MWTKCHSLAITSILLSSNFRLLAFFLAFGAIPFAKSARACSASFRASDNFTSGIAS